MPSARRRSDLLAIADAQMGLITAAQLADLGIRSSTVNRWVLGGMWTRVLPGVHLVDGGEPRRMQREFAGMLHCGPSTCLTGLTALRRHDVRALGLQELADDDPLRPEPVHSLVPHTRRRKSTGFLRVERTHRMPDDVVIRSQLALAPVARATADAARRLRLERDVIAVVTEVLQRGLCSLDDLMVELELGQMRGSGHLRKTLLAVADGAASPPEVDLRDIAESLGLGAVFYNVALFDSRGDLVAVPDAWLADVGLAVEVDSVEHHSRPGGFERTVRRNARYAAAGVPFLTLLPHDITHRAGAVGQQILRAAEAAAAAPRPDVRMARTGTGRAAGATGWRWGA